MKEINKIKQMREELITRIRQAVEKENGCIGTYYKNVGKHHTESSVTDEYDGNLLTVAIHDVACCQYGGYEGASIYDLFINDQGALQCTFNDEQCEYFDSSIDCVQVEGLLLIKQWLLEHEFMPLKDTSDIFHCSECGSINVQKQAWVDPNNNNSFIHCDDDEGWCDTCEQHFKIIPHNELMVSIEYWWKHLDNGEVREVITGLVTGDYDPANDYQAFDEACDEIWSAKTDDKKIAIWKSLTQRENE